MHVSADVGAVGDRGGSPRSASSVNRMRSSSSAVAMPFSVTSSGMSGSTSAAQATAAPQRLGTALHAVREGLQLRRGGDEPVGAEPGAACRSAARPSRRPSAAARNWSSNAARSSRMRSSPPSSAMFSRPISVMPDAEAGAAEHIAVRPCSASSASATPWSGRGRPRIGSPRMAIAPSTGWRGHQVRFVDRGDVRGVAQAPAAANSVYARDPVAGLRPRPAAVVHQPAGHREVHERDDRVEPRSRHAVDHPPVVVEGGAGELALLGLDPAPLEAEPVGVQAGAGDAGRGPRASGGRSRRRRRWARRTASAARAPSPSGRC